MLCDGNEFQTKAFVIAFMLKEFIEQIISLGSVVKLGRQKFKQIALARNTRRLSKIIHVRVKAALSVSQRRWGWPYQMGKTQPYGPPSEVDVLSLDGPIL